ncbi:MAG: sensor histidine kinase [Candidatus Dormiibacterota bacterium]
MRFLSRPYEGDELDRIPRPVRALVGAGLTIWLGADAIQRFPLQSPAVRALNLAVTVIVLGAICFTWIVPTPRWPRRRLAVNGLVAAGAVVSLVVEGGNNAGEVGAYVAVIMASASGIFGLPIAALTAAAYFVHTATTLHGVALSVQVLVLGGAAAGMAVAYFGPVWSRYVWTMRTEAAATGERERISREMHDVLAHTLSGLTVKLEATRLLAEQRPGDPAIAASLDSAHQLAREGLLEARRAVSTLRGDVPGPAQLERLLHDFEVESGIRCRLDVEGRPVELKPDAQLALYRTAQEALTNIRKHADATSVVVRLAWSRRSAELTVEDQGTPKASLAPGGYGLTGIRERAALLGGTLEAGPTAEGFRVRLQVPA